MKKYAILAMDVEEWYHTYPPNSTVDTRASAMDGLETMLRLLEEKNLKATFFITVELAEKLAPTLREIDRHGHEIACHDWYHRRPATVDGAEHKKNLLRAKETLQEILSHPVSGYRAPSFGTDDEHFRLVRECGFSYDSSKTKPQISKKYGTLNLKDFQEVLPTIYRNGDFTEFEVSSQKIGPFNLLLGGGYLRFLPFWLIRVPIRRYLKSGKPYVTYLHPIDLSLMRGPQKKGLSLNFYLRARLGRKSMAKKLQKILALLEEFGYESVTFEELLEKEF